MMRVFVYLSAALFVMTAAAAEPELPKSDNSDGLDIEPPLLIQNGRALAPNATTIPAAESDPERLQVQVDHARQSAAAAERQYRAGIIARAQVDERAIKLVRLESDLAAAQLRVAKQSEPSAARITVATEAARVAMAKRDAAERAFAETNLHRQQKLLALGSGRKADVEHAAEKLAALASEKKN